ncbi:DUF937 domain-containing protein [Spirosoma foliorum]|uniref:DUF937 domain-containing protein n=1 Tax=Spirosoma foliorum TaxID=2710596 RepID=A0A7G5GY03_9BACT|nr:DUF937 domain-containing protein [Spirosoma foliorum]QMW03745.1 DUF937 domain-containing protein [Spirosoma foliorum]
MNLFANLTNVLNSDVLSRIATYIDEPTEKTTKAVNGLVYTIIGGLMKRTTSEIGVNQLYNHIQKGRYDGSLTENLPAVLKDAALTNTLITQGNDVISHLLPAMKSSIGSMISGYAGIRNSSSIGLLGLTTTIVLHVLGKQVKDQKLDADGLAASLFSERDAFVNAVPEDFMPQLVEKVGLHQVVAGLAMPARRTTAEPSGRTTTTVTRPTISYEPTDDSDSENETLTKWGVGALIAVALAVGGYYLYQNTQKYSNGEEAIEVTSMADTVQTDTVARSLAVPKDSTAKTAPKPAPAATTPVAATSAVATGGLTQQLAPYLGNAALPKGRIFPLTGITFQPGSLSMTAGAQATVNELATILKTYPQLQIQLVGYANDATGEFTNKSLSFKRVNQIKQQLMASGINFMRIDAIGRGTGVAKGDTSRIPKPTLKKIDLKVVVK